MKSKKLIIFLIVAMIIGIIYFFFFSKCKSYLCSLLPWNKGVELQMIWNKYDSEKFGIKFQYPKDYYLETRELGNDNRWHFQIMLTENTETNKAIREGKLPATEGPVAITFDLYQSPEEPTPLDWVKGHNGSNFKLSDGTYEEMTLAEKSAISYRWSGLYEADNIVLAHKDYIASIAVTYITKIDKTRIDFYEIIETLKFY